ncbi:MAG: NAD(P)-dependent oxidoreductase [Phycisphaerae bacterium]
MIGMGIMGRPMALNLCRAGYHVSIHSRTRGKADEVIAAGAQWFPSPAALAAKVDVLITIVTDSPDVEQVLFGENGAAAGLKPGTLVIDCSTIDPDAARNFADRLAAQNVAFLDAPVTGGDAGAKAGTLTIMVGGDAAAFDRAKPVLESIGKKVVHLGPSGAGQTLKACNQILCAVNMIGICEALQLGAKNGLDLRVALETLGSGAGGSWAWSNLGPKIVNRDFDPAFMIRLIQKDLRIVQSIAGRSGVPLFGTALAEQLFRAAQQHEPTGTEGTQAMFRAYEDLVGR